MTAENGPTLVLNLRRTGEIPSFTGEEQGLLNWDEGAALDTTESKLARLREAREALIMQAELLETQCEEQFEAATAAGDSGAAAAIRADCLGEIARCWARVKAFDSSYPELVPNIGHAVPAATSTMVPRVTKGLPAKDEAGHKAPPKGYPAEKTEYGDPANYKYPLDTAEHVRAANSYISMPKNRTPYTAAELDSIEARIHRAGKKLGVSFAASDD